MQTCLILAVLAFGQADHKQWDALTLLDGEVLYGYVELEDDKYVHFRVVKSDGKISYVRRVPRRHIRELARNRPPSPKADRPAPTEDTPQEPEGNKTGQIQDKAAYLRAIFNEWEVRNIADASLRLVRLINQASPAELIELEQLTRQKYNIGLARFTAQVHISYALQRSEEGYFKLYFVMPFHLSELHDELEQVLAETIDIRIRYKDPEQTLEVSTRADSIAYWIGRPSDYDGTGPAARVFARQITRALGMNRELERLSRALKMDLQVIQDLNEQNRQLRALLTVVNRRKQMTVDKD